MNPTTVKAIIALLLMGVLCFLVAKTFMRTRSTGLLLELIGAAGLAMLGVTHLLEGLHVLPWMRWGTENGPGHYLNLVCVAVGVTLLPVGYIAAKRQRLRD